MHDLKIYLIHWEKKSPQQNGFVDYIFLVLLKFSCNYAGNGRGEKYVYFFQINYFVESFG